MNVQQMIDKISNGKVPIDLLKETENYGVYKTIDNQIVLIKDKLENQIITIFENEFENDEELLKHCSQIILKHELSSIQKS